LHVMQNFRTVPCLIRHISGAAPAKYFTITVPFLSLIKEYRTTEQSHGVRVQKKPASRSDAALVTLTLCHFAAICLKIGRMIVMRTQVIDEGIL